MERRVWTLRPSVCENGGRDFVIVRDFVVGIVVMVGEEVIDVYGGAVVGWCCWCYCRGWV